MVKIKQQTKKEQIELIQKVIDCYSVNPFLAKLYLLDKDKLNKLKEVEI
jgi:hypothetical protein